MSALRIIGNDQENATIQRALVFYQQHIVAERKAYQSGLPTKGKSPVAPDDDSKEAEYDCELRNIAIILKSQKNSPRSSVRDVNIFTQPDPREQEIVRLKDVNTEPHLNPLAGHPIAPDTHSDPSFSKVGPTLGGLKQIKSAESTAIIDVPTAQKYVDVEIQTPSSRPSFPLNSVHNTPAVRFRPQPSFNANEVGKFGSTGGNQAYFISSGQLQRGSYRTDLTQIQNEDESGRGFLTRENQPRNIDSGPELGRNLSVKHGKTSTSTSQELLPGSEVSAGPRDPVQPVFDARRNMIIDHISELKDNVPNVAEKNGNNALSLAHRIAQQFAAFNGETQLNNSLAPNNFSARESWSHIQQRLGSVGSSKIVCQTANTTHQTGSRTWSLLQDEHEMSTAFGRSGEQSQKSSSLRLRSVDDHQELRLVPNSKWLGSKGSFDDQHADERLVEKHEPSPSESQNRRFPNRPIKRIRSDDAGRQFASKASPNQVTTRGPASNPMKSGESSKKKYCWAENHSIQPTANTSREEHKSSTKIYREAQIKTDFRLAQTIANREKQDDLAALQKLQDDWNREKDQYEFDGLMSLRQSQDNRNNSITPNLRIGRYQLPPPQESSSRGVSNSVNFVASSDDDESEPSVSSNLLGSNPPQLQSLTSQRVSNSGPKKPKSQAECTVCGDSENTSQMLILPSCKHEYHPSCLMRAFHHALAGGKLFICCNKEPAPIDLAAPYLPIQFITNYKAKMVERSTPNPIYCAKPGCAAFVPPVSLKGQMATCQKCGFVTCSLCRNPEHKGYVRRIKMGVSC